MKKEPKRRIYFYKRVNGKTIYIKKDQLDKMKVKQFVLHESV